ncbi:class I SAM-dependent methyltransferase [Intrasporangium sp. DVR]|uniref:O-methyltransferase n=1 Tax=Intrasporangium sp. DVR TaxID=3127867 RepID=UPI00313A5ECB
MRVAGRWGPTLLFARVELRARLLQPGIRRSVAQQAADLRHVGDSQAERLAGALDRIAADQLPAESARALDRIEAARRAMLRSAETVPWADDTTQSLARICARASQPPSGARLLHHVVAMWQPREALELGTCVGVSAAYQAAAMPSGALTSLEAYPALARQAERTWREAGIDNARVVVGRLADTLAPTLAGTSWDYAFIDANHQGAATERYVEQVSRAASPGALLALDDIDYSAGMRSAWESVRQREDVAASAVVGKIGLLALR